MAKTGTGQDTHDLVIRGARVIDGTGAPERIGDCQMDTYHRWMQVVVPASLAGLPVVTIPAGFSKEGLPMGIQLIGRRFGESKLLQIAQRYHETVDWPSKPELDLPA